MLFGDLVALAKAGYGPKDVKQILEMLETSPAVKDSKVEEVQKAIVEPKVEQTNVQETKEEKDEYLELFAKLAKED